MTDPLDVMRRCRPPAAGPDAALTASARAELMAAARPTAARPPMTHPPAWRRRRRLVPLALGVLVVSTAAAYAVLRSDPRTVESVACSADAALDDISVIPSASGDPVADCAAWWQATFGVEAPALAAFVNEAGGVIVVPVSAGAPGGAIQLPEGFQQDRAVLILRHEIDELTRGIGPATCLDSDGAAAMARRQLSRVGLEGWAVGSENGRADGSTSCAVARVDADGRRVALHSRPAPQGPAPEPLQRLITLSRTLTSSMVQGPAARCLSGAEAAALVDREALGLDLGGGMIEVTEAYGAEPAPDGAATCTRPTVNVGGTGFVYLDSVTADAFERDRTS